MRLLKAALNGARINTVYGAGTAFPGLGGGRFTAGAFLGVHCFTMPCIWRRTIYQLQQVGRKAMILLTDGQDERQSAQDQKMLEAAQKSDGDWLRTACA